MRVTPEALLQALLAFEPRPTSQAPDDCRGLYGLVDHTGALCYIGSTRSANETLHKRIHRRHRTGSEDSSHYFSRMYNTGRMWRDRNDMATKGDDGIAKRLRNEFITDHCRAVWVPLTDDLNIAALEAAVLAIAPPHAVAWNNRRMAVYTEPVDLVDVTIARLGLGEHELSALDRQDRRYQEDRPQTGTAPATTAPSVPALPKGLFRFFALDVETANYDRGSICQIGVACVRADGSIETWATYVDPQTSAWKGSWLHGITAETVRGAPSFAQILPLLGEALEGHVVYQHSGFDRSAFAAACSHAGLPMPAWDWRDIVGIARNAWPELKGNGGHGLANLKAHLRLDFNHHDAGDDARAAAEVVLQAEGAPTAIIGLTAPHALAEDFDVIDDDDKDGAITAAALSPALDTENSAPQKMRSLGRIGVAEITQGNIDNAHIYLRTFFSKFLDT